MSQTERNPYKKKSLRLPVLEEDDKENEINDESTTTTTTNTTIGRHANETDTDVNSLLTKNLSKIEYSPKNNIDRVTKLNMLLVPILLTYICITYFPLNAY